MSTNRFSSRLRRDVSDRLVSVLGERVRFDEMLAPYLAYRVGGKADALVFPRTEDELIRLSEIVHEFSVPVSIIGNGTNLLVLDGGIRGITVLLSEAFREIEPIEEDRNRVCVRVGGGVEKQHFLRWAMDRSFTGLEFSAGVPGTIGGGIFMNAGTKYGCYGDILKEILLYSFQRGSKTVRRQEVHFGYREQTAVQTDLVLYVVFELSLGNREQMEAEVTRILAERVQKQPLDFPSCGSTFKNPEGLSAGRLIERAGLKGFSVGGGQVSEKHANFILNRGSATAKDILLTIQHVEKKVDELFGIHLEREVILLGEPLD